MTIKVTSHDAEHGYCLSWFVSHASVITGQKVTHNIPGIPLTCPFSLVSGFNFFLGTNPRLTKIVTLELHKEVWLMGENKPILAAA